MPSTTRYVVSLGVGLIVAVLAAELATTGHLIVLSLVPLYGAATSLLVAHRRRWLSLSRGSASRSAKRRGATIGGVGALTGSLLLQTSIPAGFAGYGLLVLGMVGAIADTDES